MSIFRRGINLEKRTHDVVEAKRRGLTVVWGQKDRLLVDCDSEAAFNKVVETLRWGRGLIGATKAWYTRSKSGNWHVYVQLGIDLSQRERALMQGALGGDPKRSLLDWRRAEEFGDLQECVLFELPFSDESMVIDLGDAETPEGY